MGESSERDGDKLHALTFGATIGGYTVRRMLGRGGFGITYEAYNRITEKHVAIKEFFPKDRAWRDGQSRLMYSKADAETMEWALRKFQETTTTLCRLRHANIVQVHDYLPANDTGYMIMELLHGQTLQHWLNARARPPSLDELRPYVEPVMDALVYVHDRGLIHRDIAPDNILITSEGRPVLIDFGSVSRDLSDARNQSFSGTVGLTKRHYTAPEQMRSKARPTPEADIYSMGAVLYRALANIEPEDGLERLVNKNDPHEPLMRRLPPGCPMRAAKAIDKALALNPEARLRRMAELRESLRAEGPQKKPGKPSEDFDAGDGGPAAKARQDRAQSQTSLDAVGERKRLTESVLRKWHEGRSVSSLARSAGLVALALAVGLGGSFIYFRSRPIDANPESTTTANHAAPAPGTRQIDQPKPAEERKPEVAAGPGTEAGGVPEPVRFFRDCADCPELAGLPKGRFRIGSDDGFANEGPAHEARVPAPFAISRRSITFAEWDACVAGGGCEYKPNDQGWGRDLRPVVNVSWDDAQTYIKWLSKITGYTYRLPSEVEWEYAARAGATTRYPWGDDLGRDHANCSGCADTPASQTRPTGSFPANAFGLYDMVGNVAQWVSDCWRSSYAAAVTSDANCHSRVVRGGSFRSDPRYIRTAARVRQAETLRTATTGFRVVRDMP